jgi:hypothetical protein
MTVTTVTNRYQKPAVTRSWDRCQRYHPLKGGNVGNAHSFGNANRLQENSEQSEQTGQRMAFENNRRKSNEGAKQERGSDLEPFPDDC